MGSWKWGWVQQGWRGCGAKWVPLGRVGRSGGSPTSSPPSVCDWGGIGVHWEGGTGGLGLGISALSLQETPNLQQWGRTQLELRGPGLGASGCVQGEGLIGRGSDGVGGQRGQAGLCLQSL